MQRSKKYRAVAEKIDGDNLYPADQAVSLVKQSATTKFDPTVDSGEGGRAVPIRERRA